MAEISALYVYPIKACRGIRVDEWPVVARGFDADRRWMIVDADGTCVTQREFSRLALVTTSFHGARLRIAAEGFGEVEIPLGYEHGSLRNVRVWNDDCVGHAHPEASSWFSEFLGARHELVYMPESHRRVVNPKYARPTDIVGFADGYPFLLISEASLEDLNRRLAEPVPMERFRPNIVVRGTAPFAEDSYAQVRLGELTFRGTKRCDRCVVTTIDIATGERSKEPLRTLATFRLEDSRVWFGMNLVHDGTGMLRVGDAVQ